MEPAVEKVQCMILVDVIMGETVEDDHEAPK